MRLMKRQLRQKLMVPGMRNWIETVNGIVTPEY